MAKKGVRVPPPDVLPGEIFVVFYDPDAETYSLVVDDATNSSYKLGADVQWIVRYFDRIGRRELGSRAVDIAREFGGAAASLVSPDMRVTPVKDKPKPARDLFDKSRDGLADLPSRY